MSGITDRDLSDIQRGDWVERFLPLPVRPYIRLARLDRPVGIWLTLFPCWAALLQAAHGFPDLRTLLVFTLGAFVMRSAGCTINDIADRNFDGQVQRTRLRPLANGEISLFGAIVFLAVQLALTASLLIFLSSFARLLAIGVLPLVVLYPFCKRFTHWPQAVLGIAFNWGMLVAWAQIAGHVPVGAVLMWAGAITWQIGYDTTYGYVDIRDDKRLGLKSTAVLFGAHGKSLISVFYALTVTAWSLGGWVLGMSSPYAFGMLVIAAHFGWQAWRFDIVRPEVNFRLFLANILTGAVLAASAFIGTL
ncbi:4-hydroxybenzoate octaprenyltransferase [uncultured Sulfitobacter sp.]|uniref:4-hydroxybenzoate octaprenyltransferase n=1 Tax=uncultured Sulfitobacter sp. TaxID=191468 RepID=UPI00261D9256|nr:4-hydroxybenzoate octaprenyltransferase [uncultured Sulfitobacter sp.]